MKLEHEKNLHVRLSTFVPMPRAFGEWDRLEALIARAANPFLCFAENDGGAGGGAGGGTADDKGGAGGKSYTDAELQQIVQGRVAKAARERDEAIALSKKASEEAAATKAALDQLQAEIEDAKAKGESEKELVKLRREHAQLRKQLDDQTTQLTTFQKERDDAIGTLRSREIADGLREGLIKANVYAPAIAQVIKLMQVDGLVELVDGAKPGERKIVVNIDGVPYDDVAKACALYLDRNPHFRSAAKGGSGTKAPNGGTGPNGAQQIPEDASTTTLLSAGLAARTRS